MAIVYKSQGAGASTETSGAALSPLCPAVVDAGDILIAHVFWEGTATAPSTPSGWTLLHGPDVIETTIARHWVFGKIADGTEDGSAVAFGNPAVTTQRAARVYSFSGRVAGTITELVTGFAATSHATDPQMPTVTTTLTGALAVALVAQNDNNAFVSPTGETGGDWVEAVAEYTVALTPGLSLGIETCTPTSNPGTVTGGTMATINDPCGVIGFQIKESNNQNITADVGALTLTGFAPTATTTANVNSNVGLGVLTLTGFAPVVTIESAGSSVNATPGFGELILSGFSPTIETPRNILPGVGAIIISGFSPTIQTPRNTTIGVGAINISGFSPTITINPVGSSVNAEPGFGVLTLSGFSPTIETPKNILPDTGQLVFTAFAPTVQTPVNTQTNFGQISISGFAPAVVTSDHKNVLPATGNIIVTGFSPDIDTSLIVSPGSGNLVLSGFSPTLQITDHKVVNPGIGELALDSFAPTVSIGINITPEDSVLQITGFFPIVTVTQNINPSPTVEKKKANFPILLTGYRIRLTDEEAIENIRNRILQDDEELLRIIKMFLNGSNRLF